MKSRLIIFVLAITFVSLAAVLVVTRGQGQIKSSQPIPEEHIPIADLQSSEPVDQSKRELQKQRGSKYKSRIPLVTSEDEANIFEIPWAHAPVEPAFPIKQSDAILTGTVLGSQAFISNDKTAVYSEFQVAVDQTFKLGGSQSISIGSTIIAERNGGRVRFPSGKIQRRGDSGKNLPQTGKQYILFLKWDEQGKDYLIITGYEVRQETVYPLDGFANENPRIYSDYNRYKDANLVDFMAELKAAIANSPRAGHQ